MDLIKNVVLLEDVIFVLGVAEEKHKSNFILKALIEIKVKICANYKSSIASNLLNIFYKE